jgi:Cof subfamily protein (haloacid dehalogenase superfamily)
MNYRLIAIDLDDTLLHSGNAVSPRTVAAITECARRGIVVTIATGRMFRSARAIAASLDLDAPIIAYNGGMIRSALSGKTLSHQPIEEDLAQEVLGMFREKGWYVQTYIDDVLYVDERNEKAREYEALAGVTAIPVGPDLYTQPGRPTKMLAIEDPATILQIRSLLRKQYGRRLFTAVSKTHFLEMAHAGVDKGRALAFLARKMEIPREKVMAIGDSENDLAMIRWAGWGVAMGTAQPHVRSEANAVTGTCDEDGVAQAIEKYVLGN